MLEEYNKKRNFKDTPEPSGNVLNEFNPKHIDIKEHSDPRFVIQKHDATRLHYDFRLESKKKKVLISWAVPKGPSLDPKVKRLAILTEDHPIDYLLFEGVIPKGNYGAGTVIVWDTGTYSLEPIKTDKKEKEDVTAQFEKGKINFILSGQKLKGKFSIIKTSKENQWILFKVHDNPSQITSNTDKPILSDITKSNPESVISGLTNNQLKDELGHQNSFKDTKDVAKHNTQKLLSSSSSLSDSPTETKSDFNNNIYEWSNSRLPQSLNLASQSKMNLSRTHLNNYPFSPSISNSTIDTDNHYNNHAGDIKPMLATLREIPFNNQDWCFEIKWDGIRALSIINNSNKSDIQSRNGNKIAKSFPEIVDSLEELKKTNNLKNTTVLDGEIVVLDNKGFPDFQSLQKRINIDSSKFIESLSRQFPATYYIFDILYLDGKDLKNLPLVERREILENFISRSNKKRIKVSRFIDGEGKDIFHSIKKMNLEGMIAKHKQSKYYPNTRAREWLKIKNTKTQDCIIIGYTRGQGNREGYFGSLLLAAKFTNLKETNNNKLKFIGHCGSGFDFKQIIKIYQQIEKMKTEKCSVDEIPYVNRETTWVKPVFVVEVKFNGWTDDKIMRSPIFLRCRVDKSPDECIIEENIKTLPQHHNGDYHDNNDRVFIPKDKDQKQQQQQQEKEDIKSHNLQTKNKNNFNIQTNNVTSTYNFKDIKNDTQFKKPSIRSSDKQIRSSKSQQQSSFNSNYNFSNLDKIYWQGSKTHPPITKRDLIEYYDKISVYILPHIRNRPLSLNRYPDGPKGKSFYQKNWQSEKPDYVNSINIYSESKGESINYLLCNNKETLLWIANLGCIEIHPWYSRVKDHQDFNHLKVDRSDLNYPDFIVFDLDPYIYSGSEEEHQEPEYNLKAFKSTVEVAFCLKNIFDKIKIKSFIKTSGKTGLHIFIPIRNLYTFEQTRSFAKITGRILNKLLPEKITVDWNTILRKDKVFYDYNQNAIGKTLSSVYSVRPTESATVSMPIEWNDLSNIIPTDFTIINVPEMLKKGDPWKNINEQKQEIDKILDKVSDLAL